MNLIGTMLKRIVISKLAALIPVIVLLFTPISFAQAEKENIAVKSGDRACLQCHKDTSMQGAHAHAVSPNNLRDITCSTCHGRISKDHMSGVKDVMRFSTEMNSDSIYRVEEQNGVCLSCHEPKQLRESLWQHDVHVTKIACSNCHTLHPMKDAMADLKEDKNAKIKLCVDCHSAIHEDLQKKHENVQRKSKP